MKSNIINFYVAILLAIVSIRVQGDSITDILNKMAKEGKSIDRLFKPSKNGSLGEGEFGVTYYRGILLRNNKEVMVKFTSNKELADYEHEIYEQLNAINNSKVEAFGVPEIYYYGTWNCSENEYTIYTMMAMTLLDNTLHEKFDNDDFNEIDFLIVIRDFVTITKYIHSRGVFIDKPFNLHHLMYHKRMGYLIDFQDANNYSDCDPASRKEFAQADWKNFLFGMHEYIKPHLDWLGIDPTNYIRRTAFNGFIHGLLDDFRAPAKFYGLRKVFIEFCKYAYGLHSKLENPFYDQMYKTVVDEIAKLGKGQKKPAVFSWLSEPERNA